jgi:hypothetical protein
MSHQFFSKANDLPTESLPKFRGITQAPVKGVKAGYVFVKKRTITQIDGPKFELPRMDLMAHVNENPDLGDPIRDEATITFFVRQEPKRKSGVEIFGAEYEL